MLGGLNVTVRQISNSNYATDKSKLFFLAIHCYLGLHFLHDPLLTAHLIYRYKFCERKMRFSKEGDKAAVKAIDSLVKNDVLGNGQMKA